jgi:hypothetical protein
LLGELLDLVALASLLTIVEPLATLGALVVLAVPARAGLPINASMVGRAGAHW